jgi:hypothetical protein
MFGERRQGHSSQELSCSSLTAQYNLNQLRFIGPFHSDIDHGSTRFRANTFWRLNAPDVWICDYDLAEVGVFFARPLSPLQLREQVQHFSAYGERHLLNGVWM